jgi:hypothetical protein
MVCTVSFRRTDLVETRCHNCTVFKKDTNGLYISWTVVLNGSDKKLKSIAWFHDKTCLDEWHAQYKQDHKIIDFVGDTGITAVISDEERKLNEFSPDNNEL